MIKYSILYIVLFVLYCLLIPVYYSWGGTSGEWNEWQTTAVEGLA